MVKKKKKKRNTTSDALEIWNQVLFWTTLKEREYNHAILAGIFMLSVEWLISGTS